jgi:hypothetical protein
MSVVRQRFSPGNDSAVGARSSVSTEERTPTRHHAGKSTPLFSPAATKGAASIKMKAVTAGRVVLLFFQVRVTPRMTPRHLSAVELDIDLARQHD